MTALSRANIAIVGVVAALSSMATIARAQEVRVDRIDVLRAGTYTATVSSEIRDTGVASGSHNEVTGASLQSVGNLVPAKLGTKFGFEYRIVGEPADAPVPIKVVTVFPAEGLRNPETGQTVYREEVVKDRLVGKVSGKGYGFDHQWELVPGTWTFEVWYSGRKLAEQSFKVFTP